MKKIAFLGFPNAGKSTFFQLLSNVKVEISDYPFTTLKPNYSLISLKDEKLEKLFELVGAKEIKYPVLEIIDLPGIIENAHQGAGLGNEFLSYARPADLVIEIIRAFENSKVQSSLGEVNPLKELEILNLEISLADLQILERNLPKAKKENLKKAKTIEKAIDLLKKTGWLFIEENFSPEEIEFLKEYNLLTIKKIAVLLNIDENFNPSLLKRFESINIPILGIFYHNFKLSSELSLIEDQQFRQAFDVGQDLNEILKHFKEFLNLITFYTFNENEARGWLIEKSANLFDCAGLIHSDFQRKFSRGEVISIDDFLENQFSSWAEAKEKGLIKQEGKDYQVKEGDIILIKCS